MLAARRPFQRPQAGLSDLSARHLGGHGIAEPGPCLARRRRCRRRREVQPFGGLDDIPRHALSRGRRAGPANIGRGYRPGATTGRGRARRAQAQARAIPKVLVAPSLASVPAKPSGEAPDQGSSSHPLTRLGRRISVRTLENPELQLDRVSIRSGDSRLGHVVEYEMSVRHVRQLLGPGRQH